MEQHQVIVVGGGIGGSAAALRAAQHGLRVVWIRGDGDTARASRARYVFNIDNMIGISGGIVALHQRPSPCFRAARPLPVPRQSGA